MPGSELAKFEWCIPVIETISHNHEYTTILDVGTGSGLLADYLSQSDANYYLDGIEIWEPYVEMFGLRDKYRKLYIMDAREFNKWDWYTLVVFGDILEHMPVEDAVTMWEAASEARYRMLSIPTVHYPQGEEHGNHYEVHVTDNWTHEEVMDTFKGIQSYSPQYAAVRAYLA